MSSDRISSDTAVVKEFENGRSLYRESEEKKQPQPKTSDFSKFSRGLKNSDFKASQALSLPYSAFSPLWHPFSSGHCSKDALGADFERFSCSQPLEVSIIILVGAPSTRQLAVPGVGYPLWHRKKPKMWPLTLSCRSRGAWVRPLGGAVLVVENQIWVIFSRCLAKNGSICKI